MTTTLLALLRISLRNLLLRRVNLLIGALIFLGTGLLVVGGSLLTSIEGAMRGSLTRSITGDLQVYSSRSRDELQGFSHDGSQPDLAPIGDFPKVKRALLEVPNVKAVVPLGVGNSWLVGGNSLDRLLEQLRAAVREQASGRETPEGRAKREALAQHVRHAARMLLEDARKGQALLEPLPGQDPLADLERATSDALWSRFETEPYPVLEFLENRVAPQDNGEVVLSVFGLGTDLESFRQAFPKVQIVDGTGVPPGHRGFLFPKGYYEDTLKLKIAHRLDLLKEALAQGRSIAGDPELQRWVRENRAQTREILIQLDPAKSQEAAARLKRALHSSRDGLDALLDELLDASDASFAERYRIFYAELAPLLELYRVRIGDVFALKSQSRSGYVSSVNVKLYGTYQFQGLEKFPLLAGLCLMDLVTFRELYGYQGPEQLEELQQMEQAASVKPLSRSEAEAKLASAEVGEAAESFFGPIDDSKALSGDPRRRRELERLDRVYSRKELEEGVILHAAVLLEDPSRLDETMARIRQVSAAQGLEVTPVSWQKLAGFLAQFMKVAKGLLYVVAAFVFLVIAVIINNATVLVTLQRVPEIGTMRAIGAHRGFVLLLVLVEALLVGLLASLPAAALGVGLVRYLSTHGVPAPAEFLYFFFGGPRLYPTLDPVGLVVPLVAVLLITSLAALHPALLATRVSPLKAMQSEE